MTEQSHSAELERELRNCQSFLTEAQDNNDPARAIQLIKVFSQLHRDVERAKIREQKYLDEKQIAAHDARLMSDVIEKMQKYMQRLWDHDVTPAEAWKSLVDELIGES